jgi:hypothetical protein
MLFTTDLWTAADLAWFNSNDRDWNIRPVFSGELAAAASDPNFAGVMQALLETVGSDPRAQPWTFSARFETEGAARVARTIVPLIDYAEGASHMSIARLGAPAVEIDATQFRQAFLTVVHPGFDQRKPSRHCYICRKQPRVGDVQYFVLLRAGVQTVICSRCGMGEMRELPLAVQCIVQPTVYLGAGARQPGDAERIERGRRMVQSLYEMSLFEVSALGS